MRQIVVLLAVLMLGTGAFGYFIYRQGRGDQAQKDRAIVEEGYKAAIPVTRRAPKATPRATRPAPAPSRPVDIQAP